MSEDDKQTLCFLRADKNKLYTTRLKTRQMTCQINLQKGDSISSSKNWLLHLIPEISPKCFISNMPTAEEFAIRKHEAVTFSHLSAEKYTTRKGTHITVTWKKSASKSAWIGQ